MKATAFALSLALLPTLVSAGLFREGGPVKNIQDKIFRKSLKPERTAVVAFVAPWCGHCQKLTPEFTKAAQSLSPLVDFYAVDCDADENKRLCAEQGIKGFPTIKSFPKGVSGLAKEYQGERTASSIVNWANGEVPMRVTGLKSSDAVSEWTKTHTNAPRALLLTTQAKVPVMWKVLASKYYTDKTKTKNIEFGAIKDADGAVAKSLGLDASEGKSKVLVWKKGDEATPTLYDGIMKYEPLSSMLDELL
ncbi:thioredoxin-like protein, partial [Clavulina sp. PMI_390]